MTKYNKNFAIELLTDIGMCLFVETSIRGSLSQISKRYAKANSKYMSNYDKSLMDSCILYLDANNLCGYAMCEYLPQSNFKWNFEEWNTDKILSLDDKLERKDVHFTLRKTYTISIMEMLQHLITKQLQQRCLIHGNKKDMKNHQLKK